MSTQALLMDDDEPTQKRHQPCCQEWSKTGTGHNVDCRRYPFGGIDEVEQELYNNFNQDGRDILVRSIGI